MTTLTASTARANFYQLLHEVSETHIPIHISSKGATAVLISEADWSAIQETLYLTSIPGMRESIQRHKNTYQKV